MSDHTTQSNQSNESFEELEFRLQQAGNALAKSTTPTPAALRTILAALQTSVTDQESKRYSWRKEDGFMARFTTAIHSHFRILATATVVVLVLAIGGTSYYLKSSPSAQSVVLPLADSSQPQSASVVPNTSSSISNGGDQNQDQDINNDLSQIDSQMNALSNDNSAADQSL